MAKLRRYGKYIIEKADGTPLDANAQYFVLRIDTDPAARAALHTYADHVEPHNPVLAEQLRNWLVDTHDVKEDRPYYCTACRKLIADISTGCACGRETELPVEGKLIKVIPGTWIK